MVDYFGAGVLIFIVLLAASASLGVSSLIDGSISVPETLSRELHTAARQGRKHALDQSLAPPGFLYSKVMIGNYATNGCAGW